METSKSESIGYRFVLTAPTASAVKVQLVGVLLDGAVPRSERERVVQLLDDLDFYVTFCHGDRESIGKLGRLRKEVLETTERSEHWGEIEDNVIDVINEVLPSYLVCVLGESEPGTIVVREREEEE